MQLAGTMMECYDNDEVSLRLHQALTGAGFANFPGNPPDDMEMEYEPLLNTLEELTLASPEEMQACEDTIMADMDEWVPINDEAQVGDEGKDLKDTDDISEEQYEHLRAKYLDPDCQPTDYVPCACIECIKLYEWDDPAGPSASFAPILYKPTFNFVQSIPKPVLTPRSHLLDPRCPSPSPPSPLPTNPAPPTKRTTVNPFPPSLYKTTTLLHCPSPTTPDPSTPMLPFYTQEYIRSLRLLKLRRRWSHLPLSDFTTELATLARSLANPANNLATWPPLAAWLAHYYATMQGVPRNRRHRVKMGLLKGLEEVCQVRVRENKAAVEELVEAKGERLVVGVWGMVRLGVDEDCEVRGSLGLGGLREFTDEVVGRMSGGWAWVD
ncbi:hypothetical protein COCMIDRAFT_84610 [Bipolaris oryzae ATCC 44560]|uniref:Uncharacterized protein n=1 Tax=Bipolaris oryzae ATCC 44560 TaxID=930090 RepID=W6ZPT7_COCMI|nr:uncharacterized protein COCMIDRAFT_84610 [Bipolaris oryzae ATCC 44560]EUC49494.1 hypothetical protein COCMIDRAFT_84610 [Bipolaris oryzae ATCC 44560]